MKKIKHMALAILLMLTAASCAGGVEMSVNERINTLDDGLYANIATNRGHILVHLYATETPLTVANFVGLSEGSLESANRSGRFYDGLTFHRVINDFMIQGGDPQGSGMGGPGYRFSDEIIPSLTFNRPGLLAMANAGPGTNGSQFFITHVPTPHLNGRHTIFGSVVSDVDQTVVNSIIQGDRIESITIIRRGAAAEAFFVDQNRFNELQSEIVAREAQAQEGVTAQMISLMQEQFPNTQESPKGAHYVITRAGSGVRASANQTISVHYEGRLLANGQIFDSSFQRNQPIEFPAGVGYVIEGWDEAVLDMLVGEERVLILPPHLGYGEAGAGGVIPGNAWLVFRMERMS